MLKARAEGRAERREGMEARGLAIGAVGRQMAGVRKRRSIETDIVRMGLGVMGCSYTALFGGIARFGI